jgi:hypothetical protein
MALVKPCRVCRHRNSPDAQMCVECGANLVSVVPVSEESLPNENKTLSLEFPFGVEIVEAGTVLGRDNADFGDRIAASENGEYVSGEHAVITRHGELFIIHHVGRDDSNFTYIDDRKIDSEAELRDGQKLSLSRHFHIFVRIG